MTRRWKRDKRCESISLNRVDRPGTEQPIEDEKDGECKRKREFDFLDRAIFPPSELEAGLMLLEKLLRG